MAAQLRQERFFAAAKANIVRRGQWSRPIESGAAPGWDAWDPPVDADQVHVVPCLLGIMATSTSRWLDSVDESEDEDVAVIIRDQRSEPVSENLQVRITNQPGSTAISFGRVETADLRLFRRYTKRVKLAQHWVAELTDRCNACSTVTRAKSTVTPLVVRF